MTRKTVTRRQLLGTAGRGITLGMLASGFGVALDARAAGAPAAGVSCMTLLYPRGEGIRFDAARYRDTHLPLVRKLLGKGLARIELRTVDAAPAGAPAVPHVAVVNLWIADAAAFAAANAQHGAELQADIANFTNGQPVVQFETVHGEAGKPRSAAKVGDSCLTILYPNTEGMRWDIDYYAGRRAGKEGHMALIMRLYGNAAIARFELRQGDRGPAPGSKAAFIGSIGIYIANQAAFDAAGKQHGPTLVQDVPNFSSVNPTAFPTTVYGVG